VCVSVCICVWFLCGVCGVVCDVFTLWCVYVCSLCVAFVFVFLCVSVCVCMCVKFNSPNSNHHYNE